MQVDTSFQHAIAYLNLAPLDASPDVVYIVDPQLRLRAFNGAWEAFARGNGGQRVLTDYPLGSDITAVMPDQLRRYFVSAYGNALRDNRAFDHDYECSSAREFRLFHQIAYPLHGGAGLVIANHLVVVKPHDQNPQRFSKRFVGAGGMIVQCANCRKLKAPDRQHAWLWVPDAVAHPFPNTSHAICPQCYDFYYPEIDE